MRIRITTILLLSISTIYGQYISGVTKPDSLATYITDTTDLSVKYANTITAEGLRAHLSVLASDEYEGRETGEPGNDRASKYIANQLNKMQAVDLVVNKSPYQEVAFTFSSWTETEIFVNDERYRHLWEFLNFPNKNENKPATIAEEVYFVGYGIDDPAYSDYGKKDLSGKVIMINKGEPLNRDSVSYITKSKEMSDWSTNINKKLEVAKSKGVALVLIIDEDIKKLLGENRRFLLGPVVELGDKTKDTISLANHAYISTNIAKAIIGKNAKKILKARSKITKRGKSKPVKLKTEFVINQMLSQKVLNGKNVVGFYEGTTKKDEILVISAHYDHIGKRGDEVFNGADDNGSGTSTVLELVDAFNAARKDSVMAKRSILFLLVTGEEKGLLGSQYYSENPIYPLENTIADINIDMVGRVDKKYENDPNYVYVIGSDRLSTDLHKINEDLNSKYSGLTLDYTYNDEKDPNRYYYRSDHYNFAKNGIPAIFFFNGVHPDYHQATDTVDKIDFETMANRGRQIFHLAWELANREDRIRVDGEVK